MFTSNIYGLTHVSASVMQLPVWSQQCQSDLKVYVCVQPYNIQWTKAGVYPWSSETGGC